RMVRAENRPEIADCGDASGDARLVELVAEEIETVRPGHIIKLVAIEIDEADTAALAEDCPGLEGFGDDGREGDRDPVGTRELKIGDRSSQLRRGMRGSGSLLAQALAKIEKRGLSRCRNGW